MIKDYLGNMMTDIFEHIKMETPFTDFNETQNELLEKFNNAFYDAQNIRTTNTTISGDDILETFDEKYFSEIENFEESGNFNDDYLLDLLTSDCHKDDETESEVVSTQNGEVSSFDYNEFAQNFEEKLKNDDSNALRNQFISLDQYACMANKGNITINCQFVPHVSSSSISSDQSSSYTSAKTNDSFVESKTSEGESPFFVPLPFQFKVKNETSTHVESDINDTKDIQDLDLSDVDICDNLSESSFDLDTFANQFHEIEATSMEKTEQHETEQHRFTVEKLPSINTLVSNNIDFNQFLRTLPPESIDFQSEGYADNSFGHLIGNRTTNNNVHTIIFPLDNSESESSQYNQVVMTQDEALIYDDPMFSSSNVHLPLKERTYSESDVTEEYEDNYSLDHLLQCKWDGCFQLYETQSALVRHIEKCHVELKRGEEFTCFWVNCPRKNKPFNARYKLLIHMRVHSGEKPNKCLFKGCKKAFARLENLKIHQRSHTGERPYLCQFANCSKSFSNSSDRAKHQRTHFDTKPYGCQVPGCSKKYTDPSSLRKHVKNHSPEEQIQLKRRSQEGQQQKEAVNYQNYVKKNCLTSMTRTRYDSVSSTSSVGQDIHCFANLDHNYSHTITKSYHQYGASSLVKQDLKNKLSERLTKRTEL